MFEAQSNNTVTTREQTGYASLQFSPYTAMGRRNSQGAASVGRRPEDLELADVSSSTIGEEEPGVDTNPYYNQVNVSGCGIRTPQTQAESGRSRIEENQRVAYENVLE